MRLPEWKKAIDKLEVPRCKHRKFSSEGEEKGAVCNGLIKPDIVFFGEDLPKRFVQLRKGDFEAADCVLVLGTSLKVAPFNGLVSMCDALTPRVLINMEKVGCTPFLAGGFDFDHAKNYRDLFLEGGCDDTVREMARELGWEKEVLALQRKQATVDGWKLMVDRQPFDKFGTKLEQYEY